MSKVKDFFGVRRPVIQPKLQMIANGDSDVNAVRSELCGSIKVSNAKLLRSIERRRREGDIAVDGNQVSRPPPRGKLKMIPGDIIANVFVQLKSGITNNKSVTGQRSRIGDLVRAQVRLSQLPDLAKNRDVVYVELGETLKMPRAIPTYAMENEPSPDVRRFGTKSLHRYGEDVLIGLIDVEGFDFSHPDFLDENHETRFMAIWDQAGTARPPPKGPSFDYGSEITRAHMLAAMKNKIGIPAYDIEPQSQMVEGSHGTHVASIVAGNLGICRKSPIAGVLISLSDKDLDRRSSFYDSTRLADAIDYLVALAKKEQKPLSINISLGTNGHAHDGSSSIARWIDTILSTPGIAVTVAAGNAGQEAPEKPGDIGWMSGRVHTSGDLPAAGLTTDIEWTVMGNRIVDISENELELWLNPQDRFSVSVRTPSGEEIGPVEPHQFIENRRLKDRSFISIYNELYHPANGLNYIGIYLSPNLRAKPVIGVPAGIWTVRLRGLEIRDGHYDGWIERDDPRRIDRSGKQEAWVFPSFFSPRSMVDSSTVSSLGCGHNIITVSNLDLLRNRINITSSQGPTRDGRPKPDVAAPGTGIVAAKGFSNDGQLWMSLTGTSMASPYVAGIAGLMLAIKKDLSAAQIDGIMRSTARPLPGTSFSWKNDMGYGVIDPEACLKAVLRIKSSPKDCTKRGR